MAPKQLKTPVLVLSLFAVGGGIALLALRPPPEDPLDVAVKAYAETLPEKVRAIQMHETVADFILEPAGQHLFVSFKEDGVRWVADKNLVQDFARFTADPAQERTILERFATRFQQRFRMKIDIKERLPVSSFVEADPVGVAGRYIIAYSIPGPSGKPPLSGRYIETYRWKDSGWEVEGVGRIMEHLFQAPRRPPPRTPQDG